MKYYSYYEFPVCKVGIAEADGCIVHVFFADAKEEGAANLHKTTKLLTGISEKSASVDNPFGDFELKESALIKKAAKELKEYFAGKRREFDLPLAFTGTDFQKKVWSALLEIPYGETRAYGQIAADIGNPKGCRAVGLANNRNPIAIICPCHRVIGADGALVGFGGGLEVKKFLLDLEKRAL